MKKKIFILLILIFILLISTFVIIFKTRKNQFIDNKNERIVANYLDKETFESILEYDNNMIYNDSFFMNSNNYSINTTSKIDIQDSSIPFTKAYYINSKNLDEKYFGNSTIAVNMDKNKFKVGDYIYLELYIKTVSCNDIMGGIPFELSGFGMDHRDTIEIVNNGKWRKYQVVNKLTNENMSNSNLMIKYEINTKDLEFYIGGFKVLKVDPPYDIDINMLPQEEIYYGGSNEDALWRIEAKKNIELNRMFDAKINIVDNGEEIEGSNLYINQLEHDYRFGSTYTTNNTNIKTSLDEKKEYFEDIFFLMNNETVLANSLKWSLEKYFTEYSEYVIKLSKKHNNTFRGHTIHWPKEENTPEDIWENVENIYLNEGLEKASDYLYAETINRVDSAVDRFEDEIYDWDVINEFPDGESYFSFDNSNKPKYLEYNVIGDWFKRVKELDSNIIRTVNDYNILSESKDICIDRIDSWDIVFEETKNVNAPVQQFGIQAHMNKLTSIEHIKDILEYMDKKYENKINYKITEFDFNVKNEDTQEKYIRDIITYTFSHPNFNGFINWNWSTGIYGDGKYDVNSMFNPDGSLSKKGASWINTIYDEFWIYNDQYNNVYDTITHKLYYGKYELFVEYNGKVYKQVFNISKNETNYNIEFDISKANIVGDKFDENLIYNRLKLIQERIELGY